MKRTKETLSGKLFIVYRILLLLLLCMVLVIAGGGIYAILRPSESGPLFRLGNTGRAAAGNSATEAPAETSVFNGIGRLRIPVAGTGASSAATMIISIAFPYPPDDAPYTEELASKIINFRSISSDYFSSLPATAFVDFNEEIAKTELLKRFNALLRLGKIESLYFNDLLILEAN